MSSHNFAKEYEDSHIDFEKFILKINPEKSAEYIKMHDFGYYSDDWMQGAWITYLYLKKIRSL